MSPPEGVPDAHPALSVGCVTVGWVVLVLVVVDVSVGRGAVVVVLVVLLVAVVAVVAVVLVVLLVGVPVGAGAVVVVVVVGATKGEVSPLSDAWLLLGVGDRFVQLRAAFQLWSAVAAGVPLRGWGRPPTMMAGRNVAETICRPTAVMSSEPLSVSGTVSS